MRAGINIGTKIGPMYIGTRLYPGQSPYGQHAGQTPRQTPAQTPHPVPTWLAQQLAVRAAHEAYEARQHTAQARQQGTVYSQPVAYRAQQPVRRGAAHWLCVALAMVLLSFLALVALVMVPFVTLPLVALVVVIKIVRTPKGAAVTNSSDNVRGQHGTAGGAVRR